MSLTTIITFITILNLHALTTSTDHDQTLETYIVHIEPQTPNTDIDLDTFYDSFLPTTTNPKSEQPRILHRYRNVLSGFSAKLSPETLKSMQNKQGFLLARKEHTYSLHTTHSPNFLGLNLNQGFWESSNYAKGVIIGLLDSGITPDHPSFNDRGMGPPPSKWKGKCEHPFEGSCNNKLIGARFIGPNHGWDQEGHGTHTAGTAGGNFIPGANIYGNANGTASGIAPLAHVAMYKVCGESGCTEGDIIAGMDAAIEDGVDVLSLSLGGNSHPYYLDGIALGAYRAMEWGILVSCSAGNDGPEAQSLSNSAPWILTVGASTLDRKVVADVVLGNGVVLEGESAFQPRDFLGKEKLPIFYPQHSDLENNFYCTPDDLSRVDVKGKIVLCDIGINGRIEKGVNVKEAGGAAMIIMNSENQGYTTSSDAHVLPATQITYDSYLKLQSYLTTTIHPEASILFKGTVIGDKQAPVLAGFSSRGPNQESSGILKPDIIGPGVNVLAAWNLPVENNTKNREKSNFNMISGTSMSCPHLSGVAALLKSAHPDWSPAAIKSAILTTADQVNLEGNPILDHMHKPASVYDIGAGHVNPSKANDPGLVYDIETDDYVRYLCGLYTSEQVAVIAKKRVACSNETTIREQDLNYPSFSVGLGDKPLTFTRTVTNVGDNGSEYEVEIGNPEGVEIEVNPGKLSFTSVGQKLKYSVSFRLTGRPKSVSGQGFIAWKSVKRYVRSPVGILFQ